MYVEQVGVIRADKKEGHVCGKIKGTCVFWLNKMRLECTDLSRADAQLTWS